MKNDIKKTLISLTNIANENKFFFGLAMILFNMGSKYLVMDISKSHESFLKSTIVRRLTIFCMFFVATKDVYASMIMTAVFVIFALGIFNEKSSVSILPASLFDDHVTKDEYELAKDIIGKYEKKTNNTK